MKKLLSILFTAVLVISFSANAEMNAREKRYVELMTAGDLSSLKQGAKNIHANSVKNTEVLDIAAEILYQQYPEAAAEQIDTLSWLVRAIGASGNGRYYNLVSEVVENAPHKKLSKHAKKALKEIPGPAETQYQQGMVAVAKKDYF